MASRTTPESTFYPVVSDDLFNERCMHEDEAWESNMFRSSKKRLLEAFVGGKMRRPVRFETRILGSFNLTLKFRFCNGATTSVALRFPRRGYSPRSLVSEKIENEVHWMQYLEEQNIAPVPHIHSWSSVPGPDGMDPYILMDFVEGQPLSVSLDRWEKTKYKDDEDDDDGQDARRRFTLHQLAAILLELSRPRFDQIGSITCTADRKWTVTRRPLTLDMYMHLSAIPNFPTDTWPTGPLSVQEYKTFVAHLRQQQMMCQRNINIPGTWSAEGYLDFQKGNDIDMARALATARGRVLSRRAMDLPTYAAHLADDDRRPAIIFCHDLSPKDILVDPATGQIRALLDLEFTNAMPASFAEDPPVWLTTFSLGLCLERGLLPSWQGMYKCTLDAFLKALAQTEKECGDDDAASFQSLSSRMQRSWTSERYLANHALHRAETTDILFHEVPALFPAPDAFVGADDVARYQEHTVRQIKSYENERLSQYKN